jgi:hypothetical protein
MQRASNPSVIFCSIAKRMRHILTKKVILRRFLFYFFLVVLGAAAVDAGAPLFFFGAFFGFLSPIRFTTFSYHLS